jgi:tRNA threonylcarbamoyladenosine biosynthesis protein TsaE
MTQSPDETREIGKLFASVLRARDVVLMTGCLGAGKTCFVGGVAEALRVKGHVSSPTFTLLHVHEPAEENRLPLNHFDVYRLDGAEDFVRHGFDEISYQDGITLIEWGDRVRGALPDDVIELAITFGSDDDERVLRFLFPEGRECDGEKIQPGKLLFSLPMIMPVENCNTGEGPIVPIMAMTDRLLADQDVFSGSLNLTQPWLDVPDLGCQLSVFLTPEADVERIKDEMHSILHKLWEDRDKFNVYVPSIEESLEACTTLAPPVCLVELGDIVSAGGVGDSTIALRALLKSKSLRPACLTVMDKNTVAQALTIGLKKRGVFSIGSDVDHGYNTRTPVHATVMNFNSDRVAPVGNTESGVLYDMGMRVLLKTDDDMYIIVNEYPSYNHDQAMVTSMGIDPRSFKVIVQKTHQMFKEGYRGIMGSFIYADTEGFTDRNLKRLPYKNARRPLYPLDDCVYTTIIHA